MRLIPDENLVEVGITGITSAVKSPLLVIFLYRSEQFERVIAA